jgi:hypothetical protein
MGNIAKALYVDTSHHSANTAENCAFFWLDRTPNGPVAMPQGARTLRIMIGAS